MPEGYVEHACSYQVGVTSLHSANLGVGLLAQSSKQQEAVSSDRGGEQRLSIQLDMVLCISAEKNSKWHNSKWHNSKSASLLHLGTELHLNEAN